MDNKRYKVTYKLLYPFVILDSRQSYDSLLAWSAFDMLQRNGERITSPNEIISIIDNLPVKKVFYNDIHFYATSSPIVDAILTQKTTIYKSLTRYKQFSVSMDILHVKEVSYLADVTDFELFKDLAENIGYIGKKRALGYGRVMDVSICPTDETISRIATIAGL